MSEKYIPSLNSLSEKTAKIIQVRRKVNVHVSHAFTKSHFKLDILQDSEPPHQEILYDL